jgi:uroporphyrin-3 C-methyltransferase
MIDKPITTNNQSLSSADIARPKTNWFTLFIAMLALLFSVAAIAAGYKHWQRTIDKVRLNQAAISELQANIDTLRKTTDSTVIRDEFAKTVQAYQSKNEDTVKSLQTLQTQTLQTADSMKAQLAQLGSIQTRLQPNTPEQANEWLLKQAELLLQTANREFAINQQPDLALQAFKQVDATLAQVSDAAYLPVRTQLSNDINTVQNFKPLQTQDYVQQLNQWIEQIAALNPAAISAQALDLTLNQATKMPQASDWETYKQQAFDKLDKAIVIKRLDQPLQAAMNVESQRLANTLLQLRLENAKTLLLTRQTTAFKAQLDLIQKILKQYDKENKLTAIQDGLKALSQVDLTPPLPDISGSLKQLEVVHQAAMATVNKQAVEQTKNESAVNDTSTENKPSGALKPEEKMLENKHEIAKPANNEKTP